jgi:AmmeMemoRadiSam system protein B
MTTIRMPAVAGMFYPDNPSELQAMLAQMLGAAPPDLPDGELPKAVIAPHAGYIYSGPVAASLYAPLARARGKIEKVVLLGPSHRVAFSGLAASSADEFVTPLGNIAVDLAAIRQLLQLPQVHLLDQAHAREHSLEVHLPFLQMALGQFSLIPLVVGEASPAEVAQALEQVWGGAETLIVVSSDLSHFHDYDTARRLDAQTTLAIEQLREDIEPEQACGCRPLNGLLHLARQRGMQCRTIDLRNSGDTAGTKDRVVGYGAYVLH